MHGRAPPSLRTPILSFPLSRPSPSQVHLDFSHGGSQQAAPNQTVSVEL